MQAYFAPYRPIADYALAMYNHYYKVAKADVFEALITDLITATLSGKGSAEEMELTDLDGYLKCYRCPPLTLDTATAMLKSLQHIVDAYIAQWFAEHINADGMKFVSFRRDGSMMVLKLVSIKTGTSNAIKDPEALYRKIKSDIVYLKSRAASSRQRQCLRILAEVGDKYRSELELLIPMQDVKECEDEVRDRTTYLSEAWDNSKQTWRI